MYWNDRGSPKKRRKMMAKKEKTIRHWGMTLTEKEHEQWHREHMELTPEEHDQFIKHMGISPEEDEKWHKEHKNVKASSLDPNANPLNPFMIGGGFLAYCVKQGWLIQVGKGHKAKYFATEKGRRELTQMDIHV
jgi:hypothetical protein